MTNSQRAHQSESVGGINSSGFECRGDNIVRKIMHVRQPHYHIGPYEWACVGGQHHQHLGSARFTEPDAVNRGLESTDHYGLS